MNEPHELRPKLKTSRVGTNLPSNRAALVGSAAVIVGLTLIFFGHSLSGGQVFAMRDTAHFYYPLFYWCAKEWGAGRLPLWNPYEGIGSPVLADATSSVLYPGKLLFILPLPFDWLFQFYIVAHFFLAAAGTWWLVREQNRSAAAATLAAIAFAFGGSVLFQYANVVFLVGAAWLPWAWTFLSRLLRGGKWSDAAWLAVILALMTLGGDPQMVVHVALLAMIGWFMQPKQTAGSRSNREVLASAGDRYGRPILSRWKSAMVIAVAFGFAGLLAALQILPSAVYAKRTTRAQFAAARSIYEIPAKPQFTAAGILGVPAGGTHHEQVYEFSIGPWRWMELFVPNVAGRPFPRHQRWLNYLPAEGSLWTPSLYMGLLPVWFAIGQLRFRRGNAVTRWLSWSALFFALGSIGWYGLGWLVREIGASVFGYDTSSWFIGHPVGGVYWLLVTFVPGYVQFRYPAKLWTIVALAIACLAARGFDAFLIRKTPQQSWLWSRGCFAAIACAALTPLVFALASDSFPNLPPDIYWGPFQLSESCRDTGWGFVQVAIVCGIAWQCAKFLSKEKVARNYTVVGWCLVVLTAADLAMGNSWQIFTAPTSLLKGSELKALPPIIRMYRPPRERWQFTTFRLRSSDARVVEGLWEDYQGNFGHFSLLDQVGAIRSYSTFVDAEYAKFLSRLDNDSRGDAIQRARFKSTLRLLGCSTVYAPIEDSPLIPGDLSFNSMFCTAVEPLPFPEKRAWDRDRGSPVDVESEEGNRLVIRVDSPQEMMLIVNVAYDKNWQAFANSGSTRKPLRIERIYDVMCSLKVPPGKQVVEMRYDPAEFRWGAGISIVAWSFLLVAALIQELRRRSTASRSTAP